ncbi:glycosyltransferase family 4 protein [Polynucleobacter paneuropaeus]|nr:glycosyltransferase family 4 protein [Polynucleobacter paneuropaeus]MBT8638136.1 glycosyltransferase family 4 protein [Polynucleobacter paneuropaeus]
MPVKIPKTFAPNKIASSKLRIYSSMDFDSAVSRKNPLGVLDAFKLAFPLKYKDVELILKIRGALHPQLRLILESYLLNDPRITIIEKTLTRAEIDELTQSCNIYLSMHRSEGFGFGPAEALACAKIVVCTDYGGTRDFINGKTGFPVEYQLTPVKPNEYPFWENQVWAEPSLESAALALRSVYDDYEKACRKAEMGRSLLLKNYSYEVIGALMKDLL